MTSKGVLLVDDEATALKYFSRAFAHRFPVFAASSASEALALLTAHHADIGVVVTDQRMPEASGVDLLKTVRQRHPQVVRILTTAYSELDVLIEAINTGAVYSFVTKPWQLDKLERTLVDALEHYEKETRNHRMLERKLEDFRESILAGRTRDLALIAAKMGHYIHNALCPVILVIDQLLEDQADARLSTAFLHSVQSHVQEISQTLKDLADISMPPLAADFEKIDLSEALDRAMANTEILRTEKDIRVDIHIDPDLPTISGVREQIVRLFRFMIAEEVVSLPRGSRIDIRLRPGRNQQQADGVFIEVEDFDPAPGSMSHSELLQPFSVRGGNPRELGIFLASSYLIADHHYGTLGVEIKKNQSLLFAIFLPFVSSDVDNSFTI